MTEEARPSVSSPADVQFVHYSTQVNDYLPCDYPSPRQCKFGTHHQVSQGETPEEAIERIHVSNMGSAAGMGTKARRKKTDYLGIAVDQWGLREKELPGIKEAWDNRFGELNTMTASEATVDSDGDDADNEVKEARAEAHDNAANEAESDDDNQGQIQDQEYHAQPVQEGEEEAQGSQFYHAQSQEQSRSHVDVQAEQGQYQEHAGSQDGQEQDEDQDQQGQAQMMRLADLRAERASYESGERPPWHVLADDYDETTRLHEAISSVSAQEGGVDQQYWEERVQKTEAQARIAQNLYEAVKGESELKEYWSKIQKLPVKDGNGQYYERSLVEKVIRIHDASTYRAESLQAAYDEAVVLPEDSELRKLLIRSGDGEAEENSEDNETAAGTEDGQPEPEPKSKPKPKSKKSRVRYSLQEDFETAKEKQESSGKRRANILVHVRTYYDFAYSELLKAQQNKRNIEENYEKWLYAGWPHEDRRPPEKNDW